MFDQISIQALYRYDVIDNCKWYLLKNSYELIRRTNTNLDIVDLVDLFSQLTSILRKHTKTP